MKLKTDLHIHTVLSPCGDVEMSPLAILKMAISKELDIIGITDHNSTRNAIAIAKAGKEMGVFVMCGAEVTTREEVHCLCFLPDEKSLELFQAFIDSRVVFFANDPQKFGFQLVVDIHENVIDEVPWLLINAIDCSIDELQRVVYDLNGIFIPAHVDKSRFSISSQLGFVPDNLIFDVMELSKFATKSGFFERFPWFADYSYISSSDAHFLSDIGSVYSELEIDRADFESVRLALKNLI